MSDVWGEYSPPNPIRRWRRLGVRVGSLADGWCIIQDDADLANFFVGQSVRVGYWHPDDDPFGVLRRGEPFGVLRAGQAVVERVNHASSRVQLRNAHELVAFAAGDTIFGLADELDNREARRNFEGTGG